MYIKIRKDWSSAELEAVTNWRSPITVITANGDVQTHEVATVYVRELDVFLIVKFESCRPGSLAGISDIHMGGFVVQKPCLFKHGVRIQGNTGNYVPIVVPGLSATSFSSISKSNIITTGKFTFNTIPAPVECKFANTGSPVGCPN